MFAGAQIGLRQRDDVGRRELPDRLEAVGELTLRVHRVDRRHDLPHLEMIDQHRVGPQRRQGRKGIRQPGRLDDDPIEARDQALGSPRVEIDQRLGELAAHGAADASGIEQDDVLVDPIEEMVVQPDLAELVDEDRRALQGRVGEQVAQQRRLARPEKAGQQVDGDLPPAGPGSRAQPSISSSLPRNSGSSGSNCPDIMASASGHRWASDWNTRVLPVAFDRI